MKTRISVTELWAKLRYLSMCRNLKLEEREGKRERFVKIVIRVILNRNER